MSPGGILLCMVLDSHFFVVSVCVVQVLGHIAGMCFRAFIYF